MGPKFAGRVEPGATGKDSGLEVFVHPVGFGGVGGDDGRPQVQLPAGEKRTRSVGVGAVQVAGPSGIDAAAGGGV